MIPTLNEEGAIGGLVKEARAAGFENILVVDGFSSDGTREAAEKAGASFMIQEFGKGKGCGVRTGLKIFLQGSAAFFSIIDGDGTNVPSCLADLIAPARRGEADVVLGSRTRGCREKGAMGLVSLGSNLIISFLLGAKFKRMFTDVQTGYWVFNRRAAERMYSQLRSTGFEIELELFVKLMKEGLHVCELPVSFRRREGVTKFSFNLRLRNLYYAFRYLVF